MPERKPFDCVEMKDRIQETLAKEWEGLGGEEIRSRIRQELEQSDDPVSRWWRQFALQAQQQHMGTKQG